MNAPPPPPYAQPPQPPYPQQPHQPYQQPPPKKKMSGCMIALAIVGGLIVLGGIGVTIAVVGFVHSDAGKKIVNAVNSGTQLAIDAQNAPGTSELRALGCAPAMVMDMEKLEALGSMFIDAGAMGKKSELRLAVTCQSSSAGTPSCDQVASTYAKAVGHASGKFSVAVTSPGGQAACSGNYSAEGTRAH